MQQAAYHFRTDGIPKSVTGLGHGQINDTYTVVTDTAAKYVLQRINTHVFKQPAELMQNVVAVSEHICRKEQGKEGASLHFIQADDGGFLYEDEADQFWRCYEFIDGFSMEAPGSDDDLYECAAAFGRFQEQLSDFPADSLFVTIPDFHNTPKRFRDLRSAVDKDICRRAQGVKEETDILLSMEREASVIQTLLDNGAIPLRVTHNDTKFNNVLFDRDTGKAKCILDLDTVMPGSSLFDFGDAVRSGAAVSPEDSEDPEQMGLDLHLFEVYVRGYLSTYRDLTREEAEHLPDSAAAITLELASRFLRDYLEGDPSFKTEYSGHNLVRARAQLSLAQDMIRKMPDMRSIVAKIQKIGTIY